jgi:hypothetical protein
MGRRRRLAPFDLRRYHPSFTQKGLSRDRDHRRMFATGPISLMAKSVEELKRLRERILQALATHKVLPREQAVFQRALQYIQEQIGPQEKPN